MRLVGVEVLFTCLVLVVGFAFSVWFAFGFAVGYVCCVWFGICAAVSGSLYWLVVCFGFIAIYYVV